MLMRFRINPKMDRPGPDHIVVIAAGLMASRGLVF
jgi:hypothetical protein